jgi:hypothetical protein
LERLIAVRLRDAASQGDPASIEQVLERHAAFLRYRFGGHLRNYRYFAGKYALAFTVLSLAVIASGFASSGIAAGWNGASWARGTILGLGLVAGIAAAINQIWRPGEKAISRMRGANALCAEAWAFLECRGRYRQATGDNEGFGLFVDEVLRIVQQASAVDESPVEGPQPPKT